jgi:hypothetical protein
VFKDFQKRNKLSSTWLEDNENGWQNLIGIIFIFPVYFLDVFKRTGNCLIRICGKNNLLDYQLLKAEIDIQRTTL